MPPASLPPPSTASTTSTTTTAPSPSGFAQLFPYFDDAATTQQQQQQQSTANDDDFATTHEYQQLLSRIVDATSFSMPPHRFVVACRRLSAFLAGGGHKCRVPSADGERRVTRMLTVVVEVMFELCGWPADTLGAVVVGEAPSLPALSTLQPLLDYRHMDLVKALAEFSSSMITRWPRHDGDDGGTFSIRLSPVHWLVRSLLQPTQADHRRASPGSQKLPSHVAHYVLPEIMTWLACFRAYFDYHTHEGNATFERLLTQEVLADAFQPHDVHAAMYASIYLMLYTPLNYNLDNAPHRVASVREARRQRVVLTMRVMFGGRAVVQSRSLDAQCLDVLGRWAAQLHPLRVDGEDFRDIPLPNDTMHEWVLSTMHRLMEFPIGAGLGVNANGTWSVGSKQVLSRGASYHNGSIRHFEDPSPIVNKYVRRDRMKSVAVFLAYQLECGRVVERLSQWLSSIEPFMHPSNAGRWQDTMARFLVYLTEATHGRVRRECLDQAMYSRQHHLPAQVRRQLVEAVMPLLKLLVFGKSHQLVDRSLTAIRHCAWLAPELVIDEVMDELVYPSMTSVLEAHRTTSAIGLMSVLAFPMFHRGHHPLGSRHLQPILELLLPGLDMNDPQKTFSAMIVYTKVFQVVPLFEVSRNEELIERVVNDALCTLQSPVLGRCTVDPAALRQHLHDLAEYSMYFPDFLERFLERIDMLIRSMPALSAHATSEQNLMDMMVAMFDILYRQCSPPALDILERWLLKWMSGEGGAVVYPAVKSLSELVRFYIYARPESVGRFVSTLERCIGRELGEHGRHSTQPSAQKIPFAQGDGDGGRARGETHPDGVLWYYLNLFRGVCSAFGAMPNGDGKQVMLARVNTFLRDLWSRVNHSRSCFSVVSRAWRSLIQSISTVYLHERGVLCGGNDEQSLRECMQWGVSPYERVCHRLGVPLSTFFKWRYLQQKPGTKEEEVMMIEQLSDQQHDRLWAELRRELDLNWHTPSALEKSSVLEMIKHWAEPELMALETLIATPPSGKESSDTTLLRLCKSLTFMHHLVQAMAFLLAPDPASLTPQSPPTSVKPAASQSGELSSMDVDNEASQTEYESEMELADLVDGDDDVDEDDGDDDGEDEHQDDGEHGGESGSKRPPLEVGSPFTDPRSPEYQYLLALRRRVGALLITTGQYMTAYRQDDVECFKVLMACADRYLSDRGLDRPLVDAHLKSYRFTKNLLKSSPGRENKMYTRYLFTMRVEIAHMQRVKRNSTSDHGNLTEMALVRQFQELFLSWSMGRYAEIRRSAQFYFASLLRSFPYNKHTIVEKVFDRLVAALDALAAAKSAHTPPHDDRTTETLEDQIKGAVYVLSNRSIYNTFMRNWKLFGRFVKVMCRLVEVDKPSIQDLLARRRLLDPFNERYTGLAFAYPLLKCLPEGTPNAATKKRSNGPSEADNIERYQAILDGLLEQHEQHPHWRITLIICHMLEDLTNREDVPVDANVMRLAIKLTNSELLPVRKSAILFLSRLMASAETRSLTRHDPGFVRTIPSAQVPARAFLYENHDGIEFEGRRYFMLSSQGWCVRPTELRVMLADGLPGGAFTDSDPQSSAAVTVMRQSLSSADFWRTFLEFTAIETARVDTKHATTTSEQFSLSTVRFYLRAAHLLQEAVLPHLMLTLKQWVANVDDKAVQRAAAELLTGLLIGVKYWPEEKRRPVWAEVMPLIKQALVGSTPDSLTHYQHFLRFTMVAYEPAQIRSLVDMLLHDEEFQFNPYSDSAFAEQKKLSFVRNVFLLFRWKVRAEALHFISQTLPHIGNRYKQVRAQLAAVLNDCLLCLRWPAGEAGWLSAEEVVSGRTMKEVVERVVSVTASTAGAHSLIDSAIAQARRLAPTANAGTAAKLYGTAYSNTMCTLLLMLNETIASGRGDFLDIVCRSPPAPHTLLHDMLLLQASDDQDLSELVIGMLLTVPECWAAYTPSSETSDGAALLYGRRFLQELARESTWINVNGRDDEQTRRFKLRLLAMLQVSTFRNWPLVSSDQALQRLVVDAVLNMLEDQHADIRQLAAISLSGLVRCLTPVDAALADRLRQRFTQMSHSSLTASSENATARRHAAALGLTSLVAAYPYDVPAWVPDVLVQLTQFASDPPPIGKSVKQLFADFRRTHQDIWHEVVSPRNGGHGFGGHGMVDVYGGYHHHHQHQSTSTKVAFTSEQLERLEGFLTSSASYYA